MNRPTNHVRRVNKAHRALTRAELRRQLADGDLDSTPFPARQPKPNRAMRAMLRESR